MGKTTKGHRRRNRWTAALLIISLFINILPIRVAVSAYETDVQNGIYSGLTRSFYGDKYTVEVTITDAWQEACNARLVIKNTGTATIDNWALTFDAGCEITNIWNAVVVDKTGVSDDNATLYKYTIKNAGHNTFFF